MCDLTLLAGLTLGAPE